MKRYKISEVEGQVIEGKIREFETRIKIYVYLKSGAVDVYSVESVTKAREHAYAIWQTGYRMRIKNRIEWFGPHWIDKICWDMPEEDYLSAKFENRKKGEII